MNYEEIEELLQEHNIPFTVPSAGCYRVTTDKHITLMFYPKSNKLIWKRNKKDFQHKFSNPSIDEVFKKIKSLI